MFVVHDLQEFLCEFLCRLMAFETAETHTSSIFFLINRLDGLKQSTDKKLQLIVSDSNPNLSQIPAAIKGGRAKRYLLHVTKKQNLLR